MKIVSACTTEDTERKAIEDVSRQLELKSPDEISWLLVFHTEEYDSAAVVDALSEKGIKKSIHGGTTCLGVMSSAGFCSQQGRALGLLAIVDPPGRYGVGAADIGNDPRGSASKALHQALENAERPGEMPSLIWMSAAPGCEEDLLQGIEDVVGPNIPVVGGSTGDNSISGKWRQIADQRVFGNAIVVSVFFPSVEVAQAFHSGYDPTSLKGTVTQADGRTLYQIDNRPAVEVYNEWTGGLLDSVIPQGGNILPLTTLAPIGKEVALVGDVEYFRLAHPEKATADGALVLFASVAEGDEITLMSGSRESLISRAGRVVKSAISAGEFAESTIQGAIMTYCAGCMLTVQDDMAKVASAVTMSINGKPFLGVFTFGEQGHFGVSQQNTHGNLMISTVVFSNISTNQAKV